jgi:transposase
MTCPRCGYLKSWLLANGRRRCARCRHDWRPERMPLRLSTTQWRAVLRWFVRGLSSAHIARETRFDRKRVLRALLVVRREMSELAPPELAQMHEHDDEERLDPGKTTDPPSQARLPVLGIYASHGRFWGEVVSESEAARIARALRERGTDRLELPDIGPYTAIVYRRRLYRVPESPESGSSMPFGQVEAFWSYLQRQLRSKGGIRRSRLNLYLAEYVWRYNHRRLSPAAQVRELMELVRHHAHRGVRNGALPRDVGSSLRHAAH